MELLLLDINEMAFEDEFYVVFSNAALHWVLDHEQNSERGLILKRLEG